MKISQLRKEKIEDIVIDLYEVDLSKKGFDILNNVKSDDVEKCMHWLANFDQEGIKKLHEKLKDKLCISSYKETLGMYLKFPNAVELSIELWKNSGHCKAPLAEFILTVGNVLSLRQYIKEPLSLTMALELSKLFKDYRTIISYSG